MCNTTNGNAGNVPASMTVDKTADAAIRVQHRSPYRVPG